MTTFRMTSLLALMGALWLAGCADHPDTVSVDDVLADCVATCELRRDLACPNDVPWLTECKSYCDVSVGGEAACLAAAAPYHACLAEAEWTCAPTGARVSGCLEEFEVLFECLHGTMPRASSSRRPRKRKVPREPRKRSAAAKQTQRLKAWYRRTGSTGGLKTMVRAVAAQNGLDTAAGADATGWLMRKGMI